MRPNVCPLPIFCSEELSHSYSFTTTTDKWGNRILVIICCVNVLLLYPGTKVYYIWRNRQRTKIWDAMTREASAWTVTGARDGADPESFTGESALFEHYKGRWK